MTNLLQAFKDIIKPDGKSCNNKIKILTGSQAKDIFFYFIIGSILLIELFISLNLSGNEYDRGFSYFILAFFIFLSGMMLYSRIISQSSNIDSNITLIIVMMPMIFTILTVLIVGICHAYILHHKKKEYNNNDIINSNELKSGYTNKYHIALFANCLLYIIFLYIMFNNSVFGPDSYSLQNKILGLNIIFVLSVIVTIFFCTKHLRDILLLRTDDNFT